MGGEWIDLPAPPNLLTVNHNGQSIDAVARYHTGPSSHLFRGGVESIAYTVVNSNLNVLGMLFFFGGLAFKISLVPFHLWTADVYEGSPIPVASYLSVISKGAAVFVLVMIGS